MTFIFGYDTLVAVRDSSGRVLLVDATKVRARWEAVESEVEIDTTKLLTAMHEAEAAGRWGNALPRPKKRSWEVIEP